MCSNTSNIAPKRPAQGTLARYWNDPVEKLVALHEPPIDDAQKERHRIYLLLLMSIVAAYWNPLKKGRSGSYLRHDAHVTWKTDYEYKGHNIAAIAVDRNGRVLDFDFNHNKLFNSSAEHAESRLVRRVFALAHISDAYSQIATDSLERLSEYDMLSEVTIYTSLESCAQCAGMMALGNVKSVVYLQSDPGMYMIGNMLRNLSDGIPKAPRPIRADEIGHDVYQEALEERFVSFVDDVESRPYWTNGSEVDDAPSISSFLTTPDARDVFERGTAAFEQLAAAGARGLSHPGALALDRDGREVPDSLTNERALALAMEFLEYARSNGRRGTPHRV